jgi:methionine synthase II (cobalamin-independent)
MTTATKITAHEYATAISNEAASLAPAWANVLAVKANAYRTAKESADRAINWCEVRKIAYDSPADVIAKMS